MSLGAGALSQGFRPLAQPVDLRFRTAPAPAVVQVLPADAADVPLDTPISVTFSRTIVPVTAVMRPAALPEIHFEPPISGSAIWLDQVTVLFRPAEPLRPGTRYRATIDAALADVTGAQLNMPFSWSFSTPAPAVLSTAPADGARLVAPRATLALTVSQPLDLASVRATLSISPTADGALAATNLPDGKQLITYTPAAGWQPNTTYVATLRAGAMPIGGNLPLIRPARWRFTTAPQPALTGRFPGEGQTLPPREEIRLVFNTPMDDATFRAGLRLTPPATVRSVTAGDAEVRVAADLQAATVYTMTLPASLPDRNGIPLGQEYQIRFLTASAGPALALPEAPDHLAQVLPGQPAGLLVRRTNLSALSFDLYRLDETTVVRMLGFQESDWSGFQPERYGQPLLRSWRVPLADPLNTSVEQRVPLSGPPGDSLAAGAYYLRLSTLEGPHGDLLLMVSRTRLTLQSSDAALLIWATDVISGTPAGGLPLALYQAGALIQQGATGADGLLQLARPANPAGSTYVALAGGALFGAVSSSPGRHRARHRRAERNADAAAGAGDLRERAPARREQPDLPGEAEDRLDRRVQHRGAARERRAARLVRGRRHDRRRRRLRVVRGRARGKRTAPDDRERAAGGRGRGGCAAGDRGSLAGGPAGSKRGDLVDARR